MLIWQERNGNSTKARHRGCKNIDDSPREECLPLLEEANDVEAGAEAGSEHLGGDTCTAREVLWKLVWKIIRKTLAKDDDKMQRKTTYSKWKINLCGPYFLINRGSGCRARLVRVKFIDVQLQNDQQRNDSLRPG